jgi:hypothetical protein
MKRLVLWLAATILRDACPETYTYNKGSHECSHPCERFRHHPGQHRDIGGTQWPKPMTEYEKRYGELYWAYSRESLRHLAEKTELVERAEAAEEKVRLLEGGR